MAILQVVLIIIPLFYFFNKIFLLEEIFWENFKISRENIKFVNGMLIVLTKRKYSNEPVTQSFQLKKNLK